MNTYKITVFSQSESKLLEKLLKNPKDDYPKLIALLEKKIEERIGQALEESNKKYRNLSNELELILDNIPSLIFYKDLNNTFVRVNKFVADGYKMHKDSLEGKSVFDLHPKEVAQAYWDDDLEVAKSGKPKLNIEEPWETSEGKRWLMTSKIPITGEDGKVNNILGISTNITERKNAEETLRLERDNFNNMLNSMEDRVYIVDQNYNIEFVNQALLSEYGPVNAKKCHMYFHDLSEVCPWCKNQEVFGGKTVRWEWYSFKNQKTYDLIDTPLKNFDGSVSKLAIFRDITERKKTEEELRLHSEIMTNMSEGVYLIRLESLIIVYANPRFEEMFGYEPGEMIGKDVVIVNAPTDKTPEETRDDIVGLLKDTGEWHGEVKNIKKDGTPFWCYANVSLFDHPEHGTVFVSVHTDITERKISEEKLKESKEKAEEAYNRTLFYQDLITHDINNVLNTFKVLTKLLTYHKNEFKEMKDVNNIIEMFKKQGFKGEKLIKNVQKLMQLEEEELKLKRVEVNDLLSQAINYIRNGFPNKNLTIHVESEFDKNHVLANDLLCDAFENILINSVKYNRNPTVEILIRSSKEEKDDRNFLKLEFIDNGIGILDERKALIFQKTGAKKEISKGMGLGLSIVSKIIQSYRGIIWVENKTKGDYTKGSNFIMLIPLLE